MFHVKQVRLTEMQTFTVSRETSDRLEILAAEVSRWTRSVQLISSGDHALIWSRHILDSLRLAPLLAGLTPPATDLGSGAGFPGLVLAIALDWPFNLIEADHRKAAFLMEAARRTGAQVVVHPHRIEATMLPPQRVITARALAPLDRLLTLAAPKLASTGACFFLKGRRYAGELTAARRRWQMDVVVHPSRTDPSRVVLQISGATLARRAPDAAD